MQPWKESVALAPFSVDCNKDQCFTRWEIMVTYEGKRGVIIPVFPSGGAGSISERPFGVFFLLSCLWSLIFAMMAAALRASTSSGDWFKWGSEMARGLWCYWRVSKNSVADWHPATRPAVHHGQILTWFHDVLPRFGGWLHQTWNLNDVAPGRCN